ncbi:MAG: hypothetical protein AB7S81_05255 [Bdellovibrionales bacterium]
MPRRKMTKISGLPKDLTTTIKLKKAPQTFFEKSGDEAETAIKRHKLEQAMSATEEAIKKLPLLYKHYDLNIGDEGSADALVMRLAIDYVPGFQVAYPKKRGRKNVWHAGTLLALWVDVQNKIIEKNCSARGACSMLLTQEKWKQALADGKAMKQGNIVTSQKQEMLKTLNNRYEESEKSPFVQLVSKLPKEKRLIHLRELVKILRDPTKMTFDE